MTADKGPTLRSIWQASVAQARTSLAAVERGDLRASANQIEAWQQTLARAAEWGLA